MGGRFAAQRVRFVDHGVEFGLRQLRRIDVVGQRQHAAGGARLDDVGSIFYVEAHGQAHLVRTVGDPVLNSRFAAKEAMFEARGVVAMSAGGADGAGRHQHPWSRNFPRGDGIAEAHVEKIRRTHVAHRRESRHQRDASIDAGIERLLRDRFCQPVHLLFPVIEFVSIGQMRVGVDEAG